MTFTTILEIDKEEIEGTLHDIGAQKMDSVSTVIKEFDIRNGKQFIPPIYRSTLFNDLFHKISQLSSIGISLNTQSYHLLLIEQGEKFELSLRSTVETYENITINITKPQYQSLIKALEAGGMKETLNLEKNIITYIYLPLRTIYTIYEWSHLSPFLYLKSPNQARLIEGLAVLGFSLDRTVSFSIEEVHKHYGIRLKLYSLLSEQS